MKAKKEKTEQYCFVYNGGTYEIQVTYKSMKNIRLRILAGGELRMSVPIGVSKTRWVQFLNEKGPWIAENAERMRKATLPQSEYGGENSGGRRTLTAAQRKAALAYLMPMVEKWYPVVAAFGAAMPHVTVRNMCTRYGSCSVGKGRITLAYILLSVPEESAEYVVFHELAHFLYPNHGKAFYGFIESYMPDWKKRKLGLRNTDRSRQETDRQHE